MATEPAVSKENALLRSSSVALAGDSSVKSARILTMKSKHILIFGLAGVLGACSTSQTGSPKMGTKTLADYQREAAKFNSVITLPVFETTTNAIAQSVKDAIAQGNLALDRIGKQNVAQVDLNSTVRALDDAVYQAGLTQNRLQIIQETSVEAALRDAAEDQSKTLDEWFVSVDYRQDVFHAIKAYSDTKPNLSGEDAKLLSETMRDYRRAGLDLPKDQQDAVESLRKKLTSLETDFEANINKAEKKLIFTKAQLDGVPEDFLGQDGVKNSDGTYSVMANITWHYMTVMENARNEDTRLKVETARENLAREVNIPLLQQMLVLRDTIGHKLGYANWADFQTEIKMVKTGAHAQKFLEDLKTGLQPKFDAEKAEFQAMKAKETGDPNAQVRLWDWRYYANQLKKQKYNVDEEALRVYFPYQNVIDGMFRIYQRIFGLKYERIEAPYKWVADLQLYAVSDASTGEPLGLFYLDMFPREGKYNHFAEFGIIEGKLLPDGKYQRPTCALICNFPAPAPGKPALMAHDDVVTIFHEFGHAMHSILTRAKYGRFAGTSVPGDFVEAPSQMLENWPWDKSVLDSFAADYRDPSKKIPAEVLGKLKEAELATAGNYYRRQLSFGLVDLALHTQIHDGNENQTVPLANRIAGEAFYSEPPDTAFIAYFGHLVGYDAGYYGYMWALSIAADMATVFQKAPDGFFDRDAGMRLRHEIYQQGGSRDVQISIEKFLGRPQSLDPFLKKIGITNSLPRPPS
jgi:thimet oligopeptidase